MAHYYSLKSFDHQLGNGSYLLKKEDFSPIEGAQSILNEANEQAKKIVEDAKKVYEQEHTRGYEEGTIAAQKAQVAFLLKEAGHLDGILRQLERDLVSLVVVCVKKLLDGFDDREKAQAIVRSALKQMRREKRVQLRVSPEQYAFFKEKVGWISAEFPEIELVDVVEDASLSSPRIIIESSIGRVDGDFGKRIEELDEMIRTAASRTLTEE